MVDVVDTTRTFSIGELARLAGVSVHTLRWYEAEGLFPRDVPPVSYTHLTLPTTPYV